MKHNFPQWICCQLGAREHYAIPRTLHQEGQLDRLITDAWVLPQSLLNRLPKPLLSHLRDRYHPDLAEASVQNFTSSLIRFELAQRLQKKWGWERIIARNEWFQKQTIWWLERISPKLNKTPIIFAYSYAALEIFRYARNRNWPIILGQIDPGLLHDKIVLDECSKYPNYQSNWQAAPPDYWSNWQEECSLADRIIVNSLWSSQALQKAGIPASKIALIPLVYTPHETKDGRFAMTRHPILVDGREVQELDCVLGLVNTALFSHQGTMCGSLQVGSVSKKNGNLTSKTRKAILKAINSSDKEHGDDRAVLQVLCDFNILLSLDQMLDNNEKSERLCRTVLKWVRGQKKGTVLDDDLRGTIRSLVE